MFAVPRPPLMDAQDWKYEMRREMQEILPGLWLGPIQSAKNVQALKEHGITHVVCIRDSGEKHIVRPFFPTDFIYYEIEVSDSPMQNLIPYFPDAKKFIGNALNQGGRVFVHCNGGISRSPAFVVAFVMESQHWDYHTAFSFVQNKASVVALRFCMNPIEQFKLQLKEYEPIYNARENIASLNYTPEQTLMQGAKRRPMPDEDDEDMGMEVETTS
ncbi:hypothetical protein SmJEL517_g04396 [Synchytrium microbalum]|uniref:protein-serine/threonine phosphatase n=1 Tax=Synchytrium microbalum TaxID=1806994 RepID=A0A507C379_9FUNG|nr:uncharacterized protein SmJEL517_g04396 [Synchytrium microbalum]TPX32544.1 hypothetical protein SmJEL517_g04396 [Synchytrium microbalum]